MDEKDTLEQSIERRKAEIEEYKDQQDLFLQELNEDEMLEYLVNTYKNNEEVIKKHNFNTISEDEVK